MLASFKFIVLTVDSSSNLDHTFGGLVHRGNLLKHIGVYGSEIEIFCNHPT